MSACYRPCFPASFLFFHAQCTYSIHQIKSNQIKSATMVPSPTLPSRVSSHRSVSTVACATRSSRAECPNRNLISAKKKNAVRFDSKRDDWCRLDNFEDMYEDVYERLCEAGIAEKLDEALWRDKDKNIVVTQAEA
jgi:hypothetical protein